MSLPQHGNLKWLQSVLFLPTCHAMEQANLNKQKIQQPLCQSNSSTGESIQSMGVGLVKDHESTKIPAI